MLIRLMLSYISIDVDKWSAKRIKNKLHGIFNHFIKGWYNEKKRLHLVNLDTVIYLINQGGLGILNPKNMNKALAAKWKYKYANNREALWKKCGVCI